jgi:translation initiation factor IF-2
MQTIAGMANRLDMSAERALEVLKKLKFDLPDVDTSISSEQCDLLMDVDEDPSALDRYLQELLKKEEEKRKRTERLQKAAQKAVAKRKAAAKKKPAAKKKAPAKKKAAAKKKASPKVEEVEPPIPVEAVAEEAPVTIEPVKEAMPFTVVEAAPVVEVEIAAPAATEEQAEVETREEALAPVIDDAEVEAAEAVPEVEAVEAVPEAEAASAGDDEVAIMEDDEVEQPVTVEILPGLESEAKEKASKSKGKEPKGALARAERRFEEEEERRKKSLEARPLATPDPAVVAAVIRKAEEKNRPPQPAKRPERSPAKVRDAAAGLQEAWTGKGKPPEGPLPEKEEGRAARGRFKRAPAATGKTAKKRQKKAERARVLEQERRRDAIVAVREVQAGALGGVRKRRKKQHKEGDVLTHEDAGGLIEVDDTMTLEQLALAMDVETSDLILQLMDDNIMATKNEVLEISIIRRLAEEHNFEVQLVIPEEEELFAEVPDPPESLVLRAPVVTVMGHVDHGKTSVLDVVREANVVDGEAGGITQHIAAYDVNMPQGRVVFLDTPGHEAFTQMRARGANITDVVVLVVAADDGVKPQTIEAIDHAKAAGVPVVVAINKCDKANAQPDRVRQELTKYELLDEDWGGKTIIRNISAQTREGITELMEMLVLESEMLELKANPNRDARGSVVESEMTTGLGATAWVLVQNGTLRVGDIFLAGESHGRVRTLTNSRGKSVEEVGPSTPVLITGFSTPPDAGDAFIVLDDERMARNVAEKRSAISRQKRGTAAKHMTLEDFHARMAGMEKRELNIIIKTDVQGSAETLVSTFGKMGNEEVSVNIVHSGVGGVNESDIMLAGASDAVVIGFHVVASAKVQQLASQEGVEVRSYRIIYEAMEDVRKALEGLLAPDSKEVVVGHAEIRNVFRSSALGNIAGCMQVDGQTDRGTLARLVRDGVVVHEGRIASVRREKDDVKSVSTGYECGLRFEQFNDIQEGDVIESYKIELVAKTLA